jgi:cell division protease FtsH
MPMSQPGQRGQANTAPWRRWLLPAAVTASFVTLLALSSRASRGIQLTYTQFLADVGSGSVHAVTIGPSGQVTGSLTSGQPFTTTIPVALGGNGLAGDLAAHHVQVAATAAASSSLLSVLIGLLPVLFIAGLLYAGIRGARRQVGGLGGAGGLGGLTRAKAQVIDAERPATRFADVAGYPVVKTEISEVVDYLRDPGRYHRAGARGPRGVLMAGPPGTGKTLLARAVAGEARVPFFSVPGSAFVEMYVGLGAARVRDLFEQARTRAPAIVFIDEIDAIGARRDRGLVGSDEREQTLNQLLAEMDGFDQSGGVVVLAATNRPDALDPALRRPGRFDREVVVPLPHRAERRAILAAHARGKTLEPDVDLDQVAAATPGFSGADLANVVNEAALTAVRAGRATLTAADFAAARDRAVLGTRDRSVTLTLDELATVAVHEAGHALVAALSPHADPVSRVTVLGAGQALGLTEMVPADDRRLYGERYLNETLAVRLGGRAAERLIRGEASTGAADDLASATALALRWSVITASATRSARSAIASRQPGTPR